MPDISYPTAPKQSNNLRLVPPCQPGVARRPSLLARLLDWVTGHFSYEEVDRAYYGWRMRAWCEDCSARVDVVQVHEKPRCASCDGLAVDEIGAVWMAKDVEP